MQEWERWAAVFLDVELYDRADHTILGKKLQDKGLPEEVVGLLQCLYAGT